MKVCVVSLVLLFFSFSCPHLGCNTTEPPPASTVRLSVEDAGVTEAWLKVSLTDSNEPRTVALRRDGQTVQTLRISSLDSIIVDTALVPHRSYSYKAYRVTDSRLIDSSTQVTLTTLDTTSHNFSWQIDTLGDGASSVLYDVAIINDTLAYAVGEIYKRDSLGNWDPLPYNLVKWNGLGWELKRVPFIGPCSAVNYPPIKAIWALSANRVLLTNGGAIVTYDGVNATLDCRMNALLTGAINKMFATSAQDIYAVGNNGNIVHYTSGTWQRVESGTTLDLQDIHGSTDGKIVWVCGYRSDYSVSVLLQMKQQQWRTVIELPLSRPPLRDSLSGTIASIWASSERGAEVGTSGGVYCIRSSSQSGEATRVWFPLVGAVGFFNRIRGSAANNVFVVGDFCTIAHFNGGSWHLYQEFFTTNPPAPRFWSVSLTERKVFAAGTVSGRAILFRGEKQ